MAATSLKKKKGGAKAPKSRPPNKKRKENPPKDLDLVHDSDVEDQEEVENESTDEGSDSSSGSDGNPFTDDFLGGSDDEEDEKEEEENGNPPLISFSGVISFLSFLFSTVLRCRFSFWGRLDWEKTCWETIQRKKNSKYGLFSPIPFSHHTNGSFWGCLDVEKDFNTTSLSCG